MGVESQGVGGAARWDEMWIEGSRYFLGVSR